MAAIIGILMVAGLIFVTIFKKKNEVCPRMNTDMINDPFSFSLTLSLSHSLSVCMCVCLHQVISCKCVCENATFRSECIVPHTSVSLSLDPSLQTV